MIKIVLARKEDLPQIRELLRELDADGYAPCEEHAEAIWERIQTYPNYRVFAAWLEGELVGCFELLIMDNLAHRGQPSAIVEDVVVHPAHRSQGIGAEMMRFAMEKAREAGCYKLMLSSNLSREDAHRFYDRLGFERHGYSFRIPLK